MRRSILRQGFVILFLGFLTGFGIVGGGPSASSWMATHLTLMLGAVLMILTGLVFDELVLSPRQRSFLRFAVVFDGYWSVVAGVFATVCHIPGPVSGHGAVPTGVAATVFFTVFIPVLTILPFIFGGLVLYGLRGSAAPAAPPADRA